MLLLLKLHVEVIWEAVAVPNFVTVRASQLFRLVNIDTADGTKLKSETLKTKLPHSRTWGTEHKTDDLPLLDRDDCQSS